MLSFMLAVLLPLSAQCQKTGGGYIGPPAITLGKSRDDIYNHQCVDNMGKGIPDGLLFTPGQDECQVCTCSNGMPILCRTVLCAPPKNCLRPRVGDACCEWSCDDSPLHDIGLRLIASAITAIVSLSLLFFLIYRLRQRKLRGRQNHLQADSSNSIDGTTDEYYGGGMMEMMDKVDGYTFTRPFPPSYDEAMLNNAGSGQSPPPPLPPSAGALNVSDTATPPYSNIGQDPVVSSYPMTVGRLVLPTCIADLPSYGDGEHCPAVTSRTLPAVFRRLRRDVIDRSEEEHAATRIESIVEDAREGENTSVSETDGSGCSTLVQDRCGVTTSPTGQRCSDEPAPMHGPTSRRAAPSSSSAESEPSNAFGVASTKKRAAGGRTGHNRTKSASSALRFHGATDVAPSTETVLGARDRQDRTDRELYPTQDTASASHTRANQRHSEHDNPDGLMAADQTVESSGSNSQRSTTIVCYRV